MLTTDEVRQRLLISTACLHWLGAKVVTSPFDRLVPLVVALVETKRELWILGEVRMGRSSLALLGSAGVRMCHGSLSLGAVQFRKCRTSAVQQNHTLVSNALDP